MYKHLFRNGRIEVIFQLFVQYCFYLTFVVAFGFVVHEVSRYSYLICLSHCDDVQRITFESVREFFAYIVGINRLFETDNVRVTTREIDTGFKSVDKQRDNYHYYQAGRDDITYFSLSDKIEMEALEPIFSKIRSKRYFPLSVARQ